MNEILRALADDLGVLKAAEEVSQGLITTHVPYQFLSALLQYMPKQEPEDQAAIDLVIAGMDQMALGKTWKERKDAEKAIQSRAAVAEDKSCAYHTIWAGYFAMIGPYRLVSDHAIAVYSPSVISQDEDAWLRIWNYERNRQREALLRMIGECPIKGESE